MGRIVGFYNLDYLDNRVACALFSLDGQLLKANTSFKKWTAAKKGASVFDLYPEMSAERFMKGIENRGRFKYKVTLEDARRGEIDLDLAFRKIERRGSEYIFLQGNDRTRDREKDAILKRATQLLEKRNRELDIANSELAKAYEQVVLSGKFMAVGEMATSLILEMRHPLELIMVNAQMLDDFVKDKDATEMMQSIIEASSKVNKIVEGLRSFGQQGEREQVADVSVKKIMDEALKLCRRQIQAGKIKLMVDEIDPDLMISCRATDISQVFLNLLNNAEEAVSGEEGAWIRIKAEKKGDHAMISITDSGEALPPALADKLMEPFFTTKDAGVGTGTGLGLTITKKIVQAHKGKLALDTDHENTRFVVTLPSA